MLLAVNTAEYNTVSDSDKDYSLVKKLDGTVEFNNDGDYNAYKEVEDEDGNVEKKESAYEEVLNLNIAEKDEEEFEDEMKTDEVQMDLYRMYLMDSSLSVSENVSEMNSLESQILLELKTEDGSYYYDYDRQNAEDDKTIQTIDKTINSSQRDAVLLALYTSDLWNTIATYNDYSVGSVNPSKKIGDTFDITVNSGTSDFYSPILNGEARHSTGCDTNNCGDIGSGREQGTRPHFGTDILADEGTWVVAGADGTIKKTSTPELSGINLYTNNGVLQTLYAQSLLKDKSRVLQDDVIGKVVDISSVYGDTINHSHIEIFESYKEQYKLNENNGIVELKKQKYDNKDTNSILFPNEANSFGLKPVTDYVTKQQEVLEKLYKLQQNNK